jgi:adiponectin receptor
MTEESAAPSSAERTLVNTPEPRDTQEPKRKMEDVASKTIERIESITLYAFSESPVYQQDNHYILSGYRGELNSFKRCLWSIWYLHNESSEDPIILH